MGYPMQSSPELRAQLRRLLALLLLLLPAICTLPALVVIAPAGLPRLIVTIILAILVLVCLTITWLILRALRKQER